MSNEERTQLYYIKQVADGLITASQASTAMNRTERHVYRLLRIYRDDGDAGLIHGLCGRSSNRGYPDRVRTFIVDLYRKSYPDYGPTLFVERLAEHYAIVIDHETARRWLIEARLWIPAQSQKRHRKKRPRRSEIGALVQADGSHHTWFEDRGAACCLFVFIDDASSLSSLAFSRTECTEDGLRSLWGYIDRFGIMHALYTDKGSIFGNPEEQTVFSRAAGRLGIKMIYANSPQAKGRVERVNRTHQDRLVKALREANICDIDAANRFLRESYIDRHNATFASTEDLVDIHRPVGDLDLRNYLCEEVERKVSAYMTIRINGQYYQIPPGRALLPVPGQRVLVRFWLDGTMHVFWKEQEIGVDLFTGRDVRKRAPSPGPSLTHPWRQSVPIGKAKRK
jgi:hypothetical protein